VGYYVMCSVVIVLHVVLLRYGDRDLSYSIFADFP